MNLESVLEKINFQLLGLSNRVLNHAETLILRGIWENETYQEIADRGGYSAGYLTNVVAPELCRKLSEMTGQKVTKKNCRFLLESYLSAAASKNLPLVVDEMKETGGKNHDYAYPSGAIPLESGFYIERSQQEGKAYNEIERAGALIRIKAPQTMGKTSLLLRILAHGERLGYKTVSLNLQQIDSDILTNLNRFLRWLCVNISYHLNIENKLDEYWDEDIGSKLSCTVYMRYVLDQIEAPLVLALDEVQCVFEYPVIAKDFFPLLRSWYEEGKRNEVWKQLRTIVVHSTEIYVPLQLTQSPFNVGLPIQLEMFTPKQVLLLAQRYGIQISEGEVNKLMEFLGGHPFLVHLALYHWAIGQTSLQELLETGSSGRGIYDNYLQRHWGVLEGQPQLLDTLQQVLASGEPLTVDRFIAYKLTSMGLVKGNAQEISPSCELYRQYFQTI
ncbi:MAG: hypothetical protein N5P05_002138 [Chroococcopsis gigantea SAG 12.99]|jgi:hypothetical protein|nr:AAA-like domain-containing protein [Chlorogloea purpurea SAG 13.99]MDV3000532.1 hypothetical protein [Chroococcopsis gigantea SAG 12.99]